MRRYEPASVTTTTKAKHSQASVLHGLPIKVQLSIILATHVLSITKFFISVFFIMSKLASFAYQKALKYQNTHRVALKWLFEDTFSSR